MIDSSYFTVSDYCMKVAYLNPTKPIARKIISCGYCNWRASEASETLSGVYKFELVRYIYIYIYIYVWRYVCHNSSACHAYVMWAELHHCHCVYVPAVLNVTTGNGTGTKNVLKWNRALGF